MDPSDRMCVPQIPPWEPSLQIPCREPSPSGSERFSRGPPWGIGGLAGRGRETDIPFLALNAHTKDRRLRTQHELLARRQARDRL